MSNLADANLAVHAAKQALEAAINNLAIAKERADELRGIVRAEGTTKLGDIRALIAEAGVRSGDLYGLVHAIEEALDTLAVVCGSMIEQIQAEIRELQDKKSELPALQ